MPNPLTGLTQIKSTDITDGTITDAKISPSANITSTKTAISTDLTDTNNPFNIGVLGFKHAVNEGLTIFNLVDGIVDEFNSEGGIDTAENSNATYDSTSDFYTNDSTASVPATTNIQAFWHNDGTFESNQSLDGGGAANNELSPFTYTAPPTAASVDLLVVGGGGAGGRGTTGSMVGSGGGGGAGGLVYIENFPVVGGGSYPITVGAGGGNEPDSGTNGADTTFTSPVPTPFGTTIVGEGGGAGGDYTGPQPINYEGGSAGGQGYSPEPSTLEPATQATNHPIPGITPAGANAIDQSPSLNLQGSYGNDGSENEQASEYTMGAGGGAGEQGTPPTPNVYAVGGAGLPYNIADGSTSIVYAGGGGGSGGYPMPTPYSPEAPGGGGRGIGGSNSQAEPADATPQNPLLNGTSPPQFGPQIAALSFGGGGGGAGNNGASGTTPAGGGNGGSGVVYVSVSETTSNSMTLVSDTFTANSTPSTSRVVLFAEIADDLNTDVAISVTRDNTTYNSVSLTDTGFVSGSSGIKIFTGSTPLTGSASPQVQMRWKVTCSSLTGNNKIHGVALQWA